MNKICIIGNSHVARLKLAYKDHNKYPLDFYGIPGQRFATLYLQNQTLLTEHLETKTYIKLTNGEDFIPLVKYNHVIIYGGGILSPGWFQYYASTLSDMYSENCLKQARIDRLNHVFGFKLAKIIKESNLCEKVTIILSPLPSEAHPSVVYKDFLLFSTPASAREILAKVELTYRNYLDECGINLIWNPPQLLSKNGFTTDINYKLSREDDVVHLNVLGSKIILDNIYSYLGM